MWAFLKRIRVCLEMDRRLSKPEAWERMVQEEFAAFKDTAEQIAEAKDTELERLLGVNASLRDEITVLHSRQVAATFQHLSNETLRAYISSKGHVMFGNPEQLRVLQSNHPRTAGRRGCWALRLVACPVGGCSSHSQVR